MQGNYTSVEQCSTDWDPQWPWIIPVKKEERLEAERERIKDVYMQKRP